MYYLLLLALLSLSATCDAMLVPAQPKSTSRRVQQRKAKAAKLATAAQQATTSAAQQTDPIQLADTYWVDEKSTQTDLSAADVELTARERALLLALHKAWEFSGLKPADRSFDPFKALTPPATPTSPASPALETFNFHS